MQIQYNAETERWVVDVRVRVADGVHLACGTGATVEAALAAAIVAIEEHAQADEAAT